MKIKFLLTRALAFLLFSCGKDAAVDAKMEEIAGKYVLQEFCVRSTFNSTASNQYLPDGLTYADMKAEIVNYSGVWYFVFTMPVKWKDGSFSFLEIEQPMAWSPMLGEYCFIGNQYAFTKKTGYNDNDTVMFYDKEKKKIVLHRFTDGVGLERWYNWKKN